jgi:hypothetical protein
VIRPFRRSDREQLTELVNAHIAAVVPGVSVSVNALMSQLEREPHELVVDPWVAERHTLVAIEHDRVAGGAQLLRYGDGESVGESYRGAAEIRWLVCDFDAPAVGDALISGCFEVLDGWGASRQWADGSLPGHFVYGVPNVWPHIRELYLRSGFVHEGHVELLLVVAVDELAEPEDFGLELRRSLGRWPRLSAVREGEVVGYVEVEADFTAGGTLSRYAGWADIGNLTGDPEVKRWLLAQAGEWLRLGGVSRLVAYARPEQVDELALYESCGFRELARTERGWIRRR